MPIKANCQYKKTKALHAQFYFLEPPLVAPPREPLLLGLDAPDDDGLELPELFGLNVF